MIVTAGPPNPSLPASADGPPALPPPEVLGAMLARGEITAGLVAGVIGGRLVGNPGVVIRDLGGIESPRAGTLTFIRSAGFAHKWVSSACGAALVSEGVEVPGHDPHSRALIYVPDADLAVAALLKAVTPKVKAPAGIHPSAVVDASAQIDPSASVGAFCVIGAGVRVGPGVVLGAHSVLEPGATIGPRTVLAPRVTIGARCQVGADCDLASGVVIGTDGFGYRRGPEGDLTKLPHVGRVVIGDRVEIGANACVDRGRFEDTTIGDGTKIDNLVQIGHNVRIGRNVVICGQSGLAGSVVVGDRAVLGAQSGIADNVIVGPRGQVAAQSGVISEVPEGRRVGGSPAVLGWEFIKHVAILRRLASSRAGRGDSRGSAPDRREGTRRPQG